MTQIYLSIGSNVERERSIVAALELLTEAFGELDLSPVYESPAAGFDGAPFYNLVAGAQTQLAPGATARLLKGIETNLGRRRDGPKFGDRTIDIDLLLHDDKLGIFDNIELPRDEIHKYPFVLRPLADLIPDRICPGSDQSFAQLWQAMSDERTDELRAVALETIKAVDLPKQISIRARDGFELAATLYRASGDKLILINSATAVSQRLYRHFAAFAQSAGFNVLTYDYRGIGGSRPESLRGFKATMSDWVFQDMAGAIDWIAASLQPKRLLALGHSVGGQLPGMLDNAHYINKMATIVAQSGYWGVQADHEKAKVRFAVSVVMPLLSHLLGYMPGSKIGAGEDLPRGVALEWSRWGRSPGYLLDDPNLPLTRYNDFAAPVLAYSIDDDGWGTARAVDAMMKAYPSVERRHIVPAEHDLKAIGHMGFFKPQSERLWSEVLEWFDRE